MDTILLRYLQELDRQLQFAEIILLHYVELQDLTDDLSSHFPELDRPLEQLLREEIRENAAAAGLPADRLRVSIHTSGGQEHLLDRINSLDNALCIFGKKVIHGGTGVLAGKIARLVSKPVLFVTETARPQIDRILVPIDFSPHSRTTMEWASRLAERLGASLVALHIYHVPPTYFPFVKDKTEQLLEEVRQRSARRLEEFCRRHCTYEKTETALSWAGDQTTAKSIYNYARSEHCDLIVMGVKGNTDDDGLLFGSVAERLIQTDRDKPVVLVR